MHHIRNAGTLNKDNSMKKLLFISFLIVSMIVFFISSLYGFSWFNKKDDITGLSENIYQYSAIDISGNTINFKQFKGKYILIVNTASKCGFVHQYGQLQELYEIYKDKLVICAFPANNFLWQEPLSNGEIKMFCNNNYNVTFPVFEKISVKGKNKHPIYKWLSNKELNGQIDKEPNWNFCKYLVDSEGKLMYYFGASIEPLSSQITDILDKNKIDVNGQVN